MTNKEKYKTPEERREAHDKWCENRTQCCSQDCEYCFNNWLDLDIEDTEGNDICYADVDDWLWTLADVDEEDNNV